MRARRKRRMNAKEKAMNFAEEISARLNCLSRDCREQPWGKAILEREVKKILECGTLDRLFELEDNKL